MRSILLTLIILASAFVSAGEGCIGNPAIIKRIASGALDESIGVNIETSYAYKSRAFQNVYFIAAKIEAIGVESSTGVWASNSLESGLIMSVNPVAKAFTVWPDASKTKARVSMEDHGGREVLDCFEL